VKYSSEYRDAGAAQSLSQEIHRITTRPWTLMEICGGQTHAIVKFGLDELLPKQIELVHGLSLIHIYGREGSLCHGISYRALAAAASVMILTSAGVVGGCELSSQKAVITPPGAHPAPGLAIAAPRARSRVRRS